MFEENMRDLYSASSFGWDPPEKHQELFASSSRFVMIDANESGTSGLLAAFTMFRFEHDEGIYVLYCYDLQIRKLYQRTGMGKLLMTALENIGTAWRMEKIVLTVFKENKNARQFYRSSGFTLDETSPGYNSDPCSEEVDYEILSKRLLIPEN